MSETCVYDHNSIFTLQNLICRTYWLFDMKEGAFLPIRKPRDPGNEVASQEQIAYTF